MTCKTPCGELKHTKKEAVILKAVGHLEVILDVTGRNRC